MIIIYTILPIFVLNTGVLLFILIFHLVVHKDFDHDVTYKHAITK